MGEKKLKPARVQVSQQELDEYIRERRPEGGTYNIWHHRYSGLERDFHKHSVRPKFKVNIARDSGETAGSKNMNAYFCIFFAKGMCTQGYKCSMWHRIPTEQDPMETTIDCFGRDKFTEFRQDMGGVGGFLRENRTLYIGRIVMNDDTENAVRRQFGQFGPLEKVRLLRSRGVAFVTYKTRANAEFAREAMMNQSLENNEILNVRWATADPRALQDDEEEEESYEEPEELTAEEIAELEERQAIESQLPPEYTTLKRDLNEDGFTQLEARYKKQKIEEAPEPVEQDPAAAESLYEYTQEDLDNYYYEQQQEEYHTQQQSQQVPQVKETKPNGIIPEDVLLNLKSLSKKANVTMNPTSKSKPATSLGSLANYGSDSEDED